MTELIKVLWPSLLTAFFVSAVVSRLLAYLYVKKGWCAPSRTGGAMPLTGGIGIFIGFVVASVTGFFCVLRETSFVLEYSVETFVIFTASLPFFILGLLDDIFHFKPLPKLTGFVLIAAVQAALLSFYFLPLCWPDEPEVLAFVAFVPTALFFFSNSYNFLDNANGHCASVFLGLSLVLLMIYRIDGAGASLGLVLGAAVLGFLIWNFPFKPKLYLGDAGSLFLGACAFVLAFYCASEFNEYDIPIKFFVFLTILAFPLYDTCAVMLLRVLRGQNPTIGGQDHYSHRLMRGGFPLWLVNLIAFTAAGILPVVFLKLPEGAVYFGPIAIWAFLLFIDVLAAFLCREKSDKNT